MHGTEEHGRSLRPRLPGSAGARPPVGKRQHTRPRRHVNDRVLITCATGPCKAIGAAGRRVGGRIGQGRSAAPGAASAARAGVRISFAGRSGSAPRQSGPRNELRHGPSTRIPLPSHAAAAACPDDTCPASHSARRPPCAAPCRGTTPDCSDVDARDLAPRPVALCTPDDRRARAVSRAPQRNGRWEVAPDSRATATWRSVPLRRVDRAAARLRRGTSGTFRCRHNARRLVRRRPREAASGCGAPYHAVITLALIACLADPLPPLAWRPV